MKLGVLASGTGTNLQAILDRVHGREGVDVVAVASDQPSAKALKRARSAGVPTAVFAQDQYAARADRDRAMAEWLAERGVELVVLAGYMRLLSPEFLERFPQRVINVHPALLPAFPGLDAVDQALAYGVKVFGATIHFVDEGVDSGAIIFQRGVELADATNADEVMAAIRPIEHELLCRAILAISRGAVSGDPDHPRRVVVRDRA
ncbi:MAG: phosphoribosylglycinamide formyltransferase [Actinomycetota bacterium]|nr:phosphoribosylglycinamide formyltransferase [Actinomycetota bacterium]